MIKDYIINKSSGLPHHWILGISVLIVGILAFFVAVPYLLIGSGIFIFFHDIFYHMKNGWEKAIKFRGDKHE